MAAPSGTADTTQASPDDTSEATSEEAAGSANTSSPDSTSPTTPSDQETEAIEIPLGTLDQATPEAGPEAEEEEIASPSISAWSDDDGYLVVSMENAPEGALLKITMKPTASLAWLTLAETYPEATFSLEDSEEGAIAIVAIPIASGNSGDMTLTGILAVSVDSIELMGNDGSTLASTDVPAAPAFARTMRAAVHSNIGERVSTYWDKDTDAVRYDNYLTYKFDITTADGSQYTGTCLNPQLPCPANGSYTLVNPLSCMTYANTGGDNAVQWQQLRIAMWYGPTGPGYEWGKEHIWPKTWYNGQPITDDQIFALQHIVLSDIYTGTAQYSLYGCSPSFTSWCETNVTGYSKTTGALLNKTAAGTKIRYYAETGVEPPPDDFVVRIVRTGSASQDLIYCETYVMNGSINVTKIASGSAAFQASHTLKGATYTVYAADGSVFGSIVTGDDGTGTLADVPVGTYTIRETEAPAGYEVDPTTYTVTVSSNEVASIESAETPQTGWLEIAKTSSDLSMTEGNTCYSLAGAQFNVYRTGDTTTPVATLVTDDQGHAQTDALEVGDYSVVETQAPSGYAIDVTPHLVTITGNQTTTVAVSDQPQSNPLTLVVRKTDAETGSTTPQGDASLAGAVFEVRWFAGSYSEDNLPENANRTWFVATNASGTASLDATLANGSDEVFHDSQGRVVVPLGTVAIQEVQAPQGYELNDETFVRQISADGSGNESVEVDLTADVPEHIMHGGLSVQKVDGETGTPTPLGAAMLEGAEFEIENASTREVIVNGEHYGPWATIMTITAGADGVASTAADALPFGSYLVREVTPPKGYLIGNLNFWQIVEVHEQGVVTAAQVNVEDLVARGDVKFSKVDETNMVRMGGVVFLVTSRTTGEKHVLVADENGSIDTSASWNPHTYLTNANDAALQEDGTIDESALDATAGVWFWGSTDRPSKTDSSSETGGETPPNETPPDEPPEETVNLLSATDRSAPVYLTSARVVDDPWAEVPTTKHSQGDPDDTRGALPYDTYTFEELSTSASEGHELVSFEVTVSRNDICVDMGTVDDKPTPAAPQIATRLTGNGGTKQVVASENVTLTDEVGYSNLTAGESYSLELQLVYQESGEAVLDGDGNPITVTHPFKAMAVSGTENVEVTIDARELEDTSIVAFERLFNADGELIAEHADLTDSDQTVSFPSIGTTLVDSTTNEHISYATSEITLVDTLTYHGLVADGRTYHAKGYLVDKETGARLTDAQGTDISADVSFVPEAADGEVEVAFTFDASALAGRRVVAQESVTYAGREVAVHADLEDEAQTVTFPQVGTTLTDAEGTHVCDPSGIVVLTDAVAMDGLLPDYTYELTGALMDAATGEALMGADGQAITASATFTPAETQSEQSVVFELDASQIDLAGKQLVAFETLALIPDDGGAPVTIAEHADLNDTGQTVTFGTPWVGTTLLSEAGTHEVAAREGVTLTDTVAYGGLEPGGTYDLVGTLVDRATGEAILDESGAPIKAHEQFVPEEPNGETQVEFKLDTNDLAGHDLVAFETISRNDEQIASHKNVDDASQTVSVVGIGTQAMDLADEDQEVEARADAQIADIVELHGVEPGATYELTTELVDAQTHDPVIAEPATAQIVPTSANITARVTMQINTLELAGRDIVFLETLTRDGVVVAEHRDYEDAGQTLHIGPAPETPPTEEATPTEEAAIPKTGDYWPNQAATVPALASGLALAAAASLIALKRR